MAGVAAIGGAIVIEITVKHAASALADVGLVWVVWTAVAAIQLPIAICIRVGDAAPTASWDTFRSVRGAQVFAIGNTVPVGVNVFDAASAIACGRL